MRLRLPFDASPQVSSGLALLFVIILSALVGWLAVDASANILRYAKETVPLPADGRPVPTTVKADR